MKPRKYKNIPTEVGGFRFDSRKEARRYGELLLLTRAGEIKDLELQTAFPLLVNGQLVGTYICDFEYKRKDPLCIGMWDRVVEDVKSPATKTPVYRIKKRLVKVLYGIEIEEV